MRRQNKHIHQINDYIPASLSNLDLKEIFTRCILVYAEVDNNPNVTFYLNLPLDLTSKAKRCQTQLTILHTQM